MNDRNQCHWCHASRPHGAEMWICKCKIRHIGQTCEQYLYSFIEGIMPGYIVYMNHWSFETKAVCFANGSKVVDISLVTLIYHADSTCRSKLFSKPHSTSTTSRAAFNKFMWADNLNRLILRSCLGLDAIWALILQLFWGFIVISCKYLIMILVLVVNHYMTHKIK